jgi:hypothetical protein
MGGSTLALDTILSATFFFSVKWSSDLQSNKARDLLRFLLCRLYDEGRGQLVNTQLTLAQKTKTPELKTEKPFEQTLYLVTFGEPTPAMRSVIDAARTIAARAM